MYTTKHTLYRSDSIYLFLIIEDIGFNFLKQNPWVCVSDLLWFLRKTLFCDYFIIKLLWLSIVCGTQEKTFWEKGLFCVIMMEINGHHHQNNLVTNIFNIYVPQKKVKQVGNSMRLSKRWQHFHFGVNEPFNYYHGILHFELIILIKTELLFLLINWDF